MNRRIGIAVVVLAACLAVVGCFNRATPQPSRTYQTGYASWYGRDFQGRPTASGEIFDMYAYTAAHRDLPFGTRVRVTNEANGHSVVVRINDRGPWVEGRILDLSYAAAQALGMLEAGVARVRLEVLR
jgi:rare lipoprotein A